jgi:hypothetical protein
VITEHAICALPETHRDWRHFAIKVRRRNNGGWVLENGGAYLRDGEWSFSGRPQEFDEQTALERAEQLAPTITVGVLTVAEALERGTR